MIHYLSRLVAPVQRQVDRLGMYRTVTLALLGLVACSLAAGAVGWLAYTPWAQLVALVPALFVAVVLNVVCARLLAVPANHESAVITTLILFFLMIPYASLAQNWPLYASVALGVLSKFVVTYRRQHIFNAAAFGAVAVSAGVWLYNLVAGTQYTTDIFSWWVSNPVLFVPTLIFGGLVVLKVRKWTPVLWFIGVGLVVYLFEAWRLELSLGEELVRYFLSWPTLFLAAFMLTEPFTMPPTKPQQAWYGGLVGGIANTAVFAPYFAMTPELALLIGNLAVYPLRLRQKLYLKLIETRLLAADTYEFVFTKPPTFHFTAGQYLEWTLPHAAPDSRGLRRYFTIASSPTEAVVRLALRVVEPGSSFKRALRTLVSGDKIIAA